jgi:hypothetical protein
MLFAFDWAFVYDRINLYISNSYLYTSGFWPRVRARALRAPVFLDS